MSQQEQDEVSVKVAELMIKADQYLADLERNGGVRGAGSCPDPLVAAYCERYGVKLSFEWNTSRDPRFQEGQPSALGPYLMRRVLDQQGVPHVDGCVCKRCERRRRKGHCPSGKRKHPHVHASDGQLYGQLYKEQLWLDDHGLR